MEDDESLKNAKITDETLDIDVDSNDEESPVKQADNPLKKEKRTTKKELFNELYLESLKLKKKDRRKYILDRMKPHFKYVELAEIYVDKNLERVTRNLICRKIRMVRKVNLQHFNYFVTFTYDDAKHDEESFKKTLKTQLRNLCHRKGWKYVGVWERSPRNNRLHFHGIFYIPEGEMIGELEEVDGYSFNTHRRHTIRQNSHFYKRIGRNDFEYIDTPALKSNAMAYIMKYLEKSGEKIVYSKGLPQYFISDILEEDIACAYNDEETKYILFDDFSCWDEGVYVGQVSKDVIEQMPKANT